MRRPPNDTMFGQKLKFYQHQNGLCWLCDEPLDLFQPVHSYGSASWEHVIPSSCGGSDRWSNMALTHWECNKRRGDCFIFRVERPREQPYGPGPQRAKYLQVGFDIAVKKLCRMLKRIEASA